MRAITLIRQTGLTAQEIADAVGCTAHAIRYYERDERFPTGKQFRALNELALSRGLRLTASDFEPEDRQEVSAREGADMLRAPRKTEARDVA